MIRPTYADWRVAAWTFPWLNSHGMGVGVCVCVKHSSKQHTHTHSWAGWLQRCVCNVSCGIVAPFVMSSREKKRGAEKDERGTGWNETERTEQNKILFIFRWVARGKTNQNFLFPVAGDELLSLISSSNIFNCVWRTEATQKNKPKNDSRPNTIDMPWPITKFIDQPGRPHDLWDLLFFN